MKRNTAEWESLLVGLSEKRTLIGENKPGFIGARGENYVRLLRMGFLASIDDSESPFRLARGPLVGTGFPGASRLNLAGEESFCSEDRLFQRWQQFSA